MNKAIKTCLSAALLLLLALPALADSYTLEYYWNTDPGVNRARKVRGAATDNIMQLTLDASDAHEGINWLGMRVYGSGRWSTTVTRIVFMPQAAASAVTSATVEYYWDVDPGVGDGLQLAVGTNGMETIDLTLLADGVAPGLHRLGLRTCIGGRWSTTQTSLVYVHDPVPDVVDALEYFWGDDPGVGEGTIVPISADAGGSVVVLDGLAIPLPAERQDSYRLTIRPHSAKGGWGLGLTKELTYVEAVGLVMGQAELAFESIGATEQLTATVYPAGSWDATVEWTSSNPEVATVDADGVVTSMAEGEAVVTATLRKADASAVETPSTDDCCLITTPDDLEQFASRVNAGENDLNALLTAPLDLSKTEHTPIGTASWPYEGRFDGQFFLITGLGHPLFGVTGKGTIERVAIESGNVRGITNGYSVHTGTLAMLTTGTTIRRCYSGANLVESEKDAGGLVGQMSDGTSMRNCYYTGSVRVGYSAAGLAGSIVSSSIETAPEIAFCFVNGSKMSIKNGDAHGIVVGWQTNNLAGRIHDVYYIASTGLTNAIGHKESDVSNITSKTRTKVKSGEVAYLLNSDQGRIVWFQTLNEDALPTLDSSHKAVMKDEKGKYINIDQTAECHVTVEDVETAIGLLEVTSEAELNVTSLSGIPVYRGPRDGLPHLERGIYIFRSGSKAVRVLVGD